MNIHSPKADANVNIVTGWFTPLKLEYPEKDTTRKTLLDIFQNRDMTVARAGILEIGRAGRLANEWPIFFNKLFYLFRSQEFSRKKPEMYKFEFKKMCSTANIDDDKLNDMTLEEFVYLFAGKMPEIFENEKKLQKDYDDAAAAGSSTTRGGSKNKSRKRSTRKPRHSRRHRRRTTTRKYKKLYK
jgi:hypothetical protein